MGISPYEGTKLHDTDEAAEVHDLGVRVPAIQYPREIEKLCTGIYFCPEALFKSLFGSGERGCFFDEVKMG